MTIILKVLGWFGLGKLGFLEGVDKDKWTTYIGAASAALIAAGDYIATGGDITNPVFWILGGIAIKEAVVGYLTNKK